ncbi:MAG: RsmE family RNA methyltransferase, partial [Rubrivivax sp.]|nr:RsmE family RNA methyltransferase [Rubrivivax sp.]
MPIRLYVDTPLHEGAEMSLPPGPARHAQVRRVQPGDALILFDGGGGEWPARVLAMGRSEVWVAVGANLPVDRELALAVTLAVGMPANERMDILVEKATELGVACIQPLVCERSVLRLSGERAERRREHWQA